MFVCLLAGWCGVRVDRALFIFRASCDDWLRLMVMWWWRRLCTFPVAAITTQCYRVNYYYYYFGENWFHGIFSSNGNWSYAPTHTFNVWVCHFLLDYSFLFHSRMLASAGTQQLPPLLMILSKCLSLERQISYEICVCVCVCEVRNCNIIDVVFAFGVDLPTTPTHHGYGAMISLVSPFISFSSFGCFFRLRVDNYF